MKGRVKWAGSGRDECSPMIDPLHRGIPVVASHFSILRRDRALLRWGGSRPIAGSSRPVGSALVAAPGG